MTTKFISLATGIVLLDVYLQSQLSSNDPLFLFASNNIVVNAALMMVVALMIAVSFRSKFRYWQSYLACMVSAVVLGIIGITGLFFGAAIYSFPQILQPLDYMFLIEASAVFGIASLSYQHQPLPANMSLPSLMPSFSRFTNFAFPVLKTLQSPHRRGSSGAQPA